MLVLSRKKGETIVIGRQIELTVLEVRKDRVKLGFSAPPEILIHRRELQHQIDGSQPGPFRAECP